MPSTLTVATTFGDLLKQLRQRAAMTQGQLAALVGFSLSQISLLEKNKRQPDLQQLVERFIPALALHDEPQLTQRLLELAASARGERLPSNLLPQLTLTRTVNVTVTDERVEHSSLPVLPVRVIGRQLAIDAICKRLMAAPGRLLTLVGSPGVGKTTLAIAVAVILQPFFGDGVTFIALATLSDPAQLATTLVNKLGLKDSNSKPAQTQLVEFLRRKSLLLILDNFEHLLPSPYPGGTHPPPSSMPSAAKLIADLLTECPNLRVLATSREPLRLRAEQRQPVQPLDRADALALFVERAQAVEPEFALSATQRPIIEAICTQLDGLPLAIELIAARADLLSPQQMFDRLRQQPLHTLTSDLHDLPDRHLTLHNAIQHSYALLSGEEQRAFRAVGVFVGSFERTAATAVGADEGSVRALLKKNLVRSERTVDEEERFSLLETLRHFVLEKLAETGEAETRRAAHCRHFVEFAQAVFVGVRGDQQALWLQRTPIDHDNLRTALRFAIDRQDGDSAVAIAGGVWWFWYRQGFINEGRRWLAESLQCSSSLTPPSGYPPSPLQSKLHRANAYNGAGSMATEQSDYVSATAYFQEAMAIFNELDDPRGIAIILHNMALVARSQGDFAQALRWLEESLDLERRHAPNKPNEALGMANIGVTAFEMGDLALAQRWLQEGLAIARQEEQGWTVAFIAGNLAEVLRVVGDLTQAAQLAEESLSRFEALNDHYYIPEPKLNLATIALIQGDLSTARRLALAVLQHYDEMKDDHGVANVLHVLARIVCAETVTADGATHAAHLLGVSIHLRAQVNRPLSIHEEKERSELLATIALSIGVAERDRLIASGGVIEWRRLVLLVNHLAMPKFDAEQHA